MAGRLTQRQTLLLRQDSVPLRAKAFDKGNHLRQADRFKIVMRNCEVARGGSEWGIALWFGQSIYQAALPLRNIKEINKNPGFAMRQDFFDRRGLGSDNKASRGHGL